MSAEWHVEYKARKPSATRVRAPGAYSVRLGEWHWSTVYGLGLLTLRDALSSAADLQSKMPRGSVMLVRLRHARTGQVIVIT